MKYLLLAIGLLCTITSLQAGPLATPVTVEISGTPKVQEVAPTSASSGEITDEYLLLPFTTPTNQLWKASVLVQESEDKTAPPMVRVAFSKLDADPEIFSALLAYSPGKKVTVYETDAYTIQMKITPVEKAK